MTENYVNVAGGKIHYQKFGSAAAQPIIVVHGGPGIDSSYLLPQMAELANDHQVIFYDQRGSGNSLGFALDEASINMHNFVADLEALRRHLGYEQFILLGHSWGGVLAMRYATLHPEHVSALILFSSAAATAAGYQSAVANYINRTRPMQDHLDAILGSDAFKAGDPQAVAEFFRSIYSIYVYDKNSVNKITMNFTPEATLSGFIAGEILQNTYLQEYDMLADLHKLTMPVLVLHGEDDVVLIETAIATQQAIPNAQLAILKQCGHFPYIEQPAECFAILQSFLAAQRI